MRWSPAFIELVLSFAGRVAAVGQMPIDEALLTSTPLYLNFDLGPPFDPQHPVWQKFLLGLHRAANPVAWTHSFYLDHARYYPVGTFGCFSYHFEPDQRTIRFHFFANNDVSGLSPLSTEQELARRAELAAMFADIQPEVPEAQAVRRLSPHTERAGCAYALDQSHQRFDAQPPLPARMTGTLGTLYRQKSLRIPRSAARNVRRTT